MSVDPFQAERQVDEPGDADTAIVDMYIEGHSTTYISQRRGIPVSQVNDIVGRGLMQSGTAAVLPRGARVLVEDARLDVLLRTYMPLARDGDRDATNICLAIGRDRRKLLGLDAPTAVTVDATLVATGIEDVVSRILETTLPIDAEEVGGPGDGFPVEDVNPARAILQRTDTTPDTPEAEG